MCAVYVDDMYRYPRGHYGRMKMSHMIADTEEELHAMADKIGVARRWVQRKGSAAHYDISLSSRKKAIAAGAVTLTYRELGLMNRLRNPETGRLPSVSLVQSYAKVSDRVKVFNASK